MTQLQQQQFLCAEALHMWWWTVALASCSLVTTVFTLRNVGITRSVASQVLTHDLSSTVLSVAACLPLFALTRVRYPQPATAAAVWSAWRLAPLGVFVAAATLLPVLRAAMPDRWIAPDLRDVPTLRYAIVASLLVGSAVQAAAGQRVS